MKKPKVPKYPKLSKRAHSILEELNSLFEIEHGGCDSSTCDMSRAFEHGYTVFAVSCFAECGAASDEFINFCKKLPKKAFDAAVSHECAAFVKDVAHDECPDCGAVVWHGEVNPSRFYCDSCNTETDKDDLRSIVKRAAASAS